MNSTALIIFAKPPVPGNVNTRLQPRVSPYDSARLQKAFILDTVHKVSNLSGLDAFIGHTESDSILFLEELIKEPGLEPFLQQGETLGLRLRNAFTNMFVRNYKKVIIIGVDSPSFPPEFISEAMDMLDKQDVVLGPTVDGGYYLVAMKGEMKAIFPNDDLGTSDVLRDAVERASNLGLNIGALAPWYDLDRVPDLEFALAHFRLLAGSGKYIPKRTAELLEELNLKDD